MNHCCEAFPRLIESFDWFKWKDDGSIRVLPVMRGTLLRLNFCPSCGSEVRHIEINAEGERLS
jgi:hypothetical protein